MENYESLGIIGEGTYGVVMKARHRDTGQVVAIKKFKESDDDEQVRKTSLREVRVLKQLRNENVITLLEVFRRRGKLHLVFEYVERTILEVLEQKGTGGMDEADVRRFMYQLLRGVEYCHAHNIVHRDIKPENILISRWGTLKLCDFGFARTVCIGGRYTDYVATRWYRSPELLVGDVEYGKPVDIWAIGCILAEITTGSPLFPGDSDLDQLAHIMRALGKLTPRMVQTFRGNALYATAELPSSTIVEPLESRFQNMPKNWLAVLRACLRIDPEQRETAAGLLAMPYFTDRNFRVDYEAELAALYEREARASGLRREPAPSHPQTQPQIVAEPVAPTADDKSETPRHSSSWAAYLQSAELPDIPLHGTSTHAPTVSTSVSHMPTLTKALGVPRPPVPVVDDQPPPQPPAPAPKKAGLFPALAQSTVGGSSNGQAPITSQLAFKKRSTKRSVLSTLSLTSFAPPRAKGHEKEADFVLQGHGHGSKRW